MANVNMFSMPYTWCLLGYGSSMFDVTAGSPLCGSDVVDVGKRGLEDEGNHFQGAPMGGYA